MNINARRTPQECAGLVGRLMMISVVEIILVFVAVICVVLVIVTVMGFKTEDKDKEDTFKKYKEKKNLIHWSLYVTGVAAFLAILLGAYGITINGKVKGCIETMNA